MQDATLSFFPRPPSPHHSRSVLQECSACGLLNRLPAPVAGTNLCCSRCAHILWSVKTDPINRAIAWALTALFFYILVFLAPLLEVTLYGKTRIGEMTSGFLTLDDLGFWILSSVVFLTTIFMPLLKTLGTLVVLVYLHKSVIPHWIATLYALLQKLDSWTMIEVYLLGFLIAYTRLQTITFVHIALAGFGLGALMMALAAMDACLDPEAIWEKIKKRAALDVSSVRPGTLIGCDTCFEVNLKGSSKTCARCGDVLHHRKPDSLTRTWALAIAAALLYVPSNLLPIMNITQLGNTKHYTIFAGIRELFTVGLWPLAMIVFTASIAIPLFKLVALTVLLIQTHRHAGDQLQARTKLYHLIEFIGRWSMVDVFMVSILVAVVRFGWITTVTPDWGVVCFSGVVVLTLLAVKTFDPRLMWDVASTQSGTPQSGQGSHVIPE